MIKTYHFETVINQNGTITLPPHLKDLNPHRVMLTLIDLKEPHSEATQILSQITEAYCQTDELDLDIAEIYENRHLVS